MKFIEQLKAVFISLKMVDKARNQEMTSADWKAIRVAYRKEYGTELADDQAEFQRQQEAKTSIAGDPSQEAADNAAALAILNAALAEASGGNDNENAPAGCAATPVQRTDSVVDAAQAIAGALREMSRQTLPDKPATVNGSALSPNGPGHTEAYFCGIEHPLYSMERRYNRIALNPALALTQPLNAVMEKEVGAEFREQLSAYAGIVAGRINELRQANLLNPALLAEGVSIGIDPKGLGDQYLTRRTDLLIARLATIRNVYDIFPRRFGVQDREVMINAFFGDFSQAYQKGGIWKGNVELQPEICYVDDAMFKTLFNSMKEIERQYIGYLNTEGSDPIKWTMIEWAMLNISTKLIEEQNQRKVLGLYVKPEDGKSGHTLNAGTGVYYTLLRYYNEGKIALVDDSAFSGYTSGATMVACVTNFLLSLSERVPDLDKYEVILNANHRAMWKAGIREIYGKDTDFTGPQGDVVPDHQNRIRWCPYGKTLPFIWVQKPGNIQSIELTAGEMHAVQFESDMEDVKAWSIWKEGTSAAYAGKPFKTKAERAAHGFEDQEIFCNKPCVALAADAEQVTVSGDFRHYVTGVNTAAKAITDIVGAKAGVAYLIEVGDETHPQTIAKSGKFADLTEAFTPTKKGDYLMVILNADGDRFRELERCVGGTRTINQALQPNVPGGR
ncbi:hypothetical protein [uncultured Rikenella sp.]|uniref:hypothetical protein n=1 Tax=uncultured Rikenella sp. TaxID=368003 RepID=UPI0025CCF0C7|nr:hypothetical protein [uncultured Rikenella sp.]